jgi:hypothetical protein
MSVGGVLLHKTPVSSFVLDKPALWVKVLTIVTSHKLYLIIHKFRMPLKNAPDLNQHPPRSPRVRLGGYVILARMLDKGRATLAGKHGEYHYNCPLDQRFLEFLGINAETLKKQLAAGKGDGEILEWIQKNAKSKRTEHEIVVWSDLCERRAPADPESRNYFNDLHSKVAPKREDVTTWFDLLDLDDYVSFGGMA